MTVNTIDDVVEEEVVSEIEDEVNEYMTPLNMELKSGISRSNRSNNTGNTMPTSSTSLGNSNDYFPKNEDGSTNIVSNIINNSSTSMDNEEMTAAGITSSSKLNSSSAVQVSSSRYDLEGNSRIVERKLKQNMDKELSFNYLDENENLFNSFLVNKETLLKEYIDVRKRIDKYILNNDQTINTIHNNNNNNNNNNTDNTNNNHSNNISNSNNNNNNNTSSNLENNINENLEELTKNNTNTNNNNSNNLNINNDMNLNKYEIMDSQNMETKNTLASLDKLMEKIIENEKVILIYNK